MFLGELLKYFGTFALSLKTKGDGRLGLQCEFKWTEKNRKSFNSANSECGFSPTKRLQKHWQDSSSQTPCFTLTVALRSWSTSEWLQRSQDCSTSLCCRDNPECGLMTALDRAWHRIRDHSRQVSWSDKYTAVSKLLLSAKFLQPSSSTSTRHLPLHYHYFKLVPILGMGI